MHLYISILPTEYFEGRKTFRISLISSSRFKFRVTITRTQPWGLSICIEYIGDLVKVTLEGALGETRKIKS